MNHRGLWFERGYLGTFVNWSDRTVRLLLLDLFPVNDISSLFLWSWPSFLPPVTSWTCGDTGRWRSCWTISLITFNLEWQRTTTCAVFQRQNTVWCKQPTLVSEICSVPVSILPFFTSFQLTLTDKTQRLLRISRAFPGRDLISDAISSPQSLQGPAAYWIRGTLTLNGPTLFYQIQFKLDTHLMTAWRNGAGFIIESSQRKFPLYLHCWIFLLAFKLQWFNHPVHACAKRVT